MKKTLFILLSIITLLFFTSTNTKAQAFAGKGSKYFTLGVGVSHFIHFGGYRNYYNSYYYEYPYYYSYYRAFSPTVSINANIEIGIHKYVGIAPLFGISTSIYGRRNVSLDIPLGVQGNFHFLQLIADKTGKSFAEKLDVYAGINLGGGPSIGFYGGSVVASGFMFVGPQVGIRYYPKSNIGITAEVGYGKTIANVGMVLKMGGSK
jgi:hypothetical protein